jgi:penicillin-binding protein 2
LIGRQGVEESYEEILRGKGAKYFKKNKYNREIGSYKDGMILLQ